MHKDPNLRKRNALVIPGGLLSLFAVVGLAYVSLLRGDTGTCEDSRLIVLAGACRSAVLVLAIPLVIGLAMVGAGAIGFRNKATCRQGWGSWAHFGLAFLIALALVPALGIFLAPGLLGEDAAITSGEVDYPVTTVFAGLTLVGVVALVPFAGLYVGRGQANRCCHDKGCFEPCFCDEPIAPEATEPVPEAPPETPPAAEPWPVEDPGEPAPAPEPAPELPPEAGTVTAPESLPEDAWEVLPDEPGPEPAPEPPARKAAAAAPALAQRPTDPAAPPQDAMAVAAKWAEEDDEAARELALSGSDPQSRTAADRKRRAKAAKDAKEAKAAKADDKKAAKKQSKDAKKKR